jgi:phosphonate transport system substrate-binding protein
MARRRSSPPLVVFGYALPDPLPEARRRVTELATVIGRLSGLDVGLAAQPSYEKVAQLLHKRELDAAWLAPIPYIALERSHAVIPLARQHLAGRSHYHSAIIVATGSGIRSLRQLEGKRAAWVDRHSASGFVIPRIQLAALGVDPRTAFASQRFYGTHEAVVSAVAEGDADFGATFVRLDRKGTIVHGPWATLPRYVRAIRTLSKFGEIPSDVVAARADIDPDIAARLQRALLDLARDPRGKILLHHIFGADELRKPDLAKSYETLRHITRDAAAEGLLDAEGDEIENADTTEIPAPRLDQTDEVDATDMEVIEPRRRR